MYGLTHEVTLPLCLCYPKQAVFEPCRCFELRSEIIVDNTCLHQESLVLGFLCFYGVIVEIKSQHRAEESKDDAQEEPLEREGIFGDWHGIICY